MINLLWPWLALVLPLPWLLRRWLPAAPPRQFLKLPYPALELTSGPPQRVPRTRLIALSLAWLLLVVAALRPQWIGPPVAQERSGRAMLLAVDISASMNTEDMQLAGRPVSRFASIEAIAGDFLARRDGDEAGLILFGSQAFLVTPLTYDLSAVESQLKGATVGLAGSTTAIGDAIAVAVKRLVALPAQGRVLILLTDGVSNAGSIEPIEAAKAAKAAGVRIYTMGIGAKRMRLPGPLGDRIVNPSADLDVNMLTQLAQLTGGRFFRAIDSQSLAEAYRAIDALEPIAQQRPMLRPHHELYPWPLSGAILLWLAMAAWRQWQGRNE